MDRDAAASAQAQAFRERSALARYLSALDPARAEEWADRLIAEFGSLGGAMMQTPEAQRRVTRDRKAAAWLQLAAELTHLWLRERAASQPVMSTTGDLMDYLRTQHAFRPLECLRVLFLNATNRLMHDELVWDGTVDQTAFWPREILRRALELQAAAVILVHNHPSGDHRPSEADVKMTRQLIDAATMVEVEVHDHFVFSSAGHSSMRKLGLI